MDKAIEIVNTLLDGYREIEKNFPSEDDQIGHYDRGRISGLEQAVERLEENRLEQIAEILGRLFPGYTKEDLIERARRIWESVNA